MEWAAFGFGLVHGFGFSFALRDATQFAGSHLLTSLFSFNVGVELGQISVIAAAALVTGPLARGERYRRFVVVPGSLAIAAVGVYWTVTRVMGP
mgnify:CR=1 FL=1